VGREETKGERGDTGGEHPRDRQREGCLDQQHAKKPVLTGGEIRGSRKKTKVTRGRKLWSTGLSPKMHQTMKKEDGSKEEEENGKEQQEEWHSRIKKTPTKSGRDILEPHKEGEGMKKKFKGVKGN